jgi:glycosyltransferase involved in cell wall biosynthesis
MTAPDPMSPGRPGATPPYLSVLFVVEQLRRSVPGGIGRYVTGILRGLADLEETGDRVPELILYASRPPPGPDPLAAYRREVVSSRLPGPALTRAWDRGLIDAPGGGDIIHASSLAFPPSRRAPLVVTIHDMAWRTVPETFPRHGRRWHEAAFQRARRRATRLVVPSETGADIVTAAGADAASVVVIPHGCDHLPPPDHGSAAALLDTLQVSGDFLLSVGTLEPRKNLARLIAAYGRARS